MLLGLSIKVSFCTAPITLCSYFHDSYLHFALHRLRCPLPPPGAPPMEGLAAVCCQHPGRVLAAAGLAGALPGLLAAYPDPGAGGDGLGSHPARAGTGTT